MLINSIKQIKDFSNLVLVVLNFQVMTKAIFSLTNKILNKWRKVRIFSQIILIQLRNQLSNSKIPMQEITFISLINQ